MEIEVRNGNIEAAIRKLRKDSTAIMKELRIRRGFESKPQKRKRKSIASARRKRRMEKRILEFKSRGNRIH